MAIQALSSYDSHLVLFSSTHVMFLEMNERRLAEAFRNKDVHFRNGAIEPIERLPSGVQLGKIYRHYSPTEKNTFS
jgi:hypothetical protein